MFTNPLFPPPQRRTQEPVRSFENHGHTFDGPYLYSDSLQPLSGVYVIMERRGPDQWRCLDVGESGDVRGRLSHHERADQWQQACKGVMYFCATYTFGLSPFRRRLLEVMIRQVEKPYCGDR